MNGEDWTLGIKAHQPSGYVGLSSDGKVFAILLDDTGVTAWSPPADWHPSIPQIIEETL